MRKDGVATTTLRLSSLQAPRFDGLLSGRQVNWVVIFRSLLLKVIIIRGPLDGRSGNAVGSWLVTVSTRTVLKSSRRMRHPFKQLSRKS